MDKGRYQDGKRGMTLTSAERQRRYRKRQCASISIAPVPVNEAMVEQLIANGHLSPKESENRQSIGQSILRVLARVLGASAGD